MFNPSLEIQSTDNYIDWTSLSIVELESNTWSSRTIPAGAQDTIDISTLKFNLPIWISPPAKVKKLGVVERVIASMYDAQGDLNNAVTNNDLLLGTRQAITPYNYGLVVIGNRIQCVKPQLVDPESNSKFVPNTVLSDSNLLWPTVIDVYGTLRPGVSQLRLEQEDGSEVIGTIVLDPNDDRFVLFTVDIDTLPQNTLAPIDAIIDPLISGPQEGLDSAIDGQRYLLIEATGDGDNQYNPVAWLGANGRPLIANANDIIEYQNNFWRVVFRAADAAGGQYVTNITTGIQYEWNGTSWVKSYQGVYPGGTWKLVL